MMHTIQSILYSFRNYYFICIGALILALQYGAVNSHSFEEYSSQPTISQSLSGITFKWDLDLNSIEQAAVQLKSGTGLVTSLQVPDFIESNIPGEVVLPEQSHLVVLPEDAKPSFEIVSSASSLLETEHSFEVFPMPSGVKMSPEGEIIGGDYSSTVELDALKNGSAMHFEEIGRMAGTRLGRLTFTPVVYDLELGDYQLITEIEVRLDYGVTIAPKIARDGSKPLSRLERSLLEQVVNPTLLGNDGTLVSGRRLQSSITPPGANLILEIDKPGVYAITVADILAADSSQSSVNPLNWQLTKEGNQVDMHWVGDGDALFESNERFLFYAPPSANRWSTSEFYTLTAGAGAGSRMSTAPTAGGLPTGKLKVSRLYEQDNNYTPNCFCGQLPTGRDGDRWIWDELRVPGNPSGSYPLELNGAGIAPSETAELTLWMIGFTDLQKENDHHLTISIDHTSLGNLIWDGKTAITHTVSIPAGRLNPASELKLALSQSENLIDGVWLDAFEIKYVKNSAAVSFSESHLLSGESTPNQYSATLSQSGWAFDITDSDHPELIGQGSSFTLKDQAGGDRQYAVLTESDIASPIIRRATPFVTHSANLLMIGPAEFEAGLAPLIQLRRSQGWSVGFVSLAEIYDSYGYGYPSPFAIQAAIKDAYDSGAVRPEAVLLVGDGTHDPKKNLANGKDTYVPVMFADVDPWIGEIPADNRYVTVDGDDVLPDILLGRLPVNNLDELSAVVNKLVAYPNQNFGWRENVTFVADDNDKAGTFSGFVSTQFSRLSTGTYNLSSVQYSGAESSLTSLRSEISQEFNRGNGHLVYVGHSTVHQWADENLMHISEVESLTNQSRLPIILQLTCFTGSFHMAGLDSFDEALLRHPTGGAVGVWGATGLSVTTGHDSLAEGYIEVLGAGNNPAIGEAIIAGKIRMMTDKPRHADLVDAYTYFGDPTLILASPAVGIRDIFLPIVTK